MTKPNIYLTKVKNNGGIKRVIGALERYLPEYGFNIVDDHTSADILNCHAGDYIESNKPLLLSCHGLYWSDYSWRESREKLLNAKIVEMMARADEITVPSAFVKTAVSRGMLKKTHTIHHGVDVEDFIVPDSYEDYIIGFAKNRLDPVCNIDEFKTIAERLKKENFLSTQGVNLPNVIPTGVLKHKDHLENISKAKIYLSLVLETGDIGALEAMAYGIPVVGWDRGALSDIVINGYNGYKVPYLNYNALQKAIDIVSKNRDILSKNARNHVEKNFQWKNKIKQYAEILHQILNKTYDYKYSIIVPAYNAENYIQKTLESINECKEDFECIIVDDCSTDSTIKICEGFCKDRENFKLYKNKTNLDVSKTRNVAIKKSKGKYILPIDSDDILMAENVKILGDALDKNKGLHIVYGRLQIKNKIMSWPSHFNWYQQMAKMNQLPYCSLVRREALENVGGYRTRYSKGEDADLWCRLTSFGYRAKLVTDKPIINYTVRNDSKSSKGKDSNWTIFYPWHIAKTTDDGLQKIKSGNFKIDYAPFGAAALPKEKGTFWDIPSFSNPKVSVIIPLGSQHKSLIIDALDSVMSQTFKDWECIVVNDTDKHINEIKGAQWAKIVNKKDFSKNLGPGSARNAGVEFSQGKWVLFLDADDYLIPDALEYLINEGEKYKDKLPIVYGDLITSYNGKRKILDEPCTYSIREKCYRPVTCLLPKLLHQKCGGFNESLKQREDWDYQFSTIVSGGCEVKIDKITFVYRTESSTRRKNHNEDIKNKILDKWKDFDMGNCPKCNKNRQALREKARQENEQKTILNISDLPEGDYIEYLGGNASFRKPAPITSNMYTIGNVPSLKVKKIGLNKGEIHPLDVPKLLAENRLGSSQYRKFTVKKSPVTKTDTQYQAEESRVVQTDLQEEVKNISNFTITEMKNEITAFSQENLKIWLKQEQESQKPRIGMIDLLTEIINNE